MLDYAFDIAVEQAETHSARLDTQPWETRPGDLLGVLLHPDMGRSAEVGSAADKQFAEAHRRRVEPSLGERHRPHPDGDDPACAGVGGRIGGRGRPGEQEPRSGRVIVHGAAHQIPRAGQALPLVDEHRRLACYDPPRCGP